MMTERRATDQEIVLMNMALDPRLLWSRWAVQTLGDCFCRENLHETLERLERDGLVVEVKKTGDHSWLQNLFGLTPRGIAAAEEAARNVRGAETYVE
jgi:hypothetical protein